MIYSLASDVVVVIHAAFVLFVVAGGFLAWRWPRAAWLHLPAALWGALVELMGWICPLTPLENYLRRLAGQAGYPGGFIDHYLVPVLYPAGLTSHTQVLLGVMVLALNLGVYSVTLLRVLRKRRSSRSTSR